MIRFLLYLFFFYALWQLIKFVFRIAFQYWLKKNAGKAFYYQGNFGNGSGRTEDRPVGDIRVDSGGNTNSSSFKKGDEGEYVDFEEVS
jgi:hypothetical protein